MWCKTTISMLYVLPTIQTSVSFKKTCITSRQKAILMNTNNSESKVRFFCLNMCGRSYKNKQHMTRHMTSECGVQPKFRCQYCKKCFTRKQTLKIHLVAVHNRSPDEILGNPRHCLNWTTVD
ncbi:zinc finger protein 425-like [Melanaphis sacchari]|uniref:zinc finger protein 425-like n=1 Tax=Melanaphis sacchari TaxID=742174 RepID=UPI000DC158E6|nr:zinc finger protein 425-like [Melanaphis sacchari]